MLIEEITRIRISNFTTIFLKKICDVGCHSLSVSGKRVMLEEQSWRNVQSTAVDRPLEVC